MKKIYVYVGQLRSWMQRIAKRVKRELFSSMNSKVDRETLCAAQDDKSQVATDEGAEVNEVRVSKVERYNLCLVGRCHTLEKDVHRARYRNLVECRQPIGFRDGYRLHGRILLRRNATLAGGLSHRRSDVSG